MRVRERSLLLARLALRVIDPRAPPGLSRPSLGTVPAAAGSWWADWALAAEYARLAARLAALPTSQAEDEALLEASSSGAAAAAAGDGWRAATLLRFRLLRKAALRAALERVRRAWATAHPGADLAALCPLSAPGSLAAAAAAAAGTPPCLPADLIAAVRPGGLLHGRALGAAGGATQALRALANPRQLLDRLDVSAVVLALAVAAGWYLLRHR